MPFWAGKNNYCQLICALFCISSCPIAIVPLKEVVDAAERVGEMLLQQQQQLAHSNSPLKETGD